MCSGKELDGITGGSKSVVSTANSLKIIACKEQQKKLAALGMELAAPGHEGGHCFFEQCHCNIGCRFSIPCLLERPHGDMIDPSQVLGKCGAQTIGSHAGPPRLSHGKFIERPPPGPLLIGPFNPCDGWMV
ncbi:hypothetical protein PVL29_002510 [Vitis rotundifolia]|uniref:Uncharacterized protein n=1 Tax=Vitis rotundifolia TaxID=103349 RepID=A0AA39AH59_VITRO|nr:hypothetical protein PVL29_002510 [Vitis rotundifolia]